MQDFLRYQPHPLYCARLDNLFPGTWLAEPVGYTGRGVVYLFRGADAEARAMAWVVRKNKEHLLGHR